MIRVSILFLLVINTFCMEVCAQKKEPVRIIFDSDMGPDYDDVGALTLLHALADKGEATLLATVASTNYEGVAAVLDVLNTYFKRPDLPIAIPTGKALELKDFQHWTDTLIARYPHSIQRNADVPGAVELYRKILSQQPDNSVTIVTVGFLTNLSDLLKSKGDAYSSLDGKALVKKKVKQLVSMAGSFPSGSEFNVRMDAAAAKHAFENFPVPVIYSGVEIGNNIRSGVPLINNTAIQNSPVKDAFRMCITMTAEDRPGRKSWDQSAVLVAVRGHEAWYTLTKGKITVDEKGNNTWDASQKNQGYLKENVSPEITAAVINILMMHQPGEN